MVLSSDNMKKYREVSKSGVVNYRMIRVSKHSKRFSDILTTYLELGWIWTFLLFIFSFIGSWIFFAILWFAIIHGHGDIANKNVLHWKPCVSNIENFVSAILFSVETQSTIGYGYRVISEECTEALILFCIQSIFGTILGGAMVGVLLIKIVSSKKRGETILFSSCATITAEAGIKKQLTFRIVNLKRSLILDVRIRAFVIWKMEDQNGILIQESINELLVEAEGEKGQGEILLYWPTTIVHEINEGSPLKMLNHSSLLFEIIVVLQGISEASGMMTQARSSYLPDEIHWGRKFKKIKMCQTPNGHKLFDLNNFHLSEPCEV